MKTVVLGGATGFIGKALKIRLIKYGYDVISISRKPGNYTMSWTEVQNEGLPQCEAVINLAGQNVLDPLKRWTPGFKQNVWASRVNTTKSLADAITKMKKPPKVFATVSGVGYYPPSETVEYDEESSGGSGDFMSELCTDWEAAAALPKELNIRQVIVRSGVVLGRQGGMIAQVYWPFFFGVGGPVGSGNQWMPWIHIDDITGIFLHTIENDNVSGVLNGVAPEVITNKQFSQQFGRALWRPAFTPLPESIVNLLFNSERALILTKGQKVIPKHTIESGYKYQYGSIVDACKSCSQFMYVDSIEETKY